MDLGVLKPADVRAVWPNEAHSFTPWLKENIDLLAKALEAQIEITGIEVPVGSFSSDLRGREVATDRVVIIENQFGATDHDHLGKLLTYASGLDAGIVIWIAEQFREEHRQTLDWINQHTDSEVDLFGIELELLQIDDSRPAPHFKIVVKPNDWAKTTRGNPPAVTDRQLQYRAFFEDLLAGFRTARPDILIRSRPGLDSYFNIPSGRGGLIFGWSFTSDGRSRVELWIDAGDLAVNSVYFEQLRTHAAEIQAKLGQQVYWEPPKPGKRSHRVAVYHSGKVDAPSQELEDLKDWAISTMSAFIDAVGPLVKRLPSPARAQVGAPVA